MENNLNVGDRVFEAFEAVRLCKEFYFNIQFIIT